MILLKSINGDYYGINCHSSITTLYSEATCVCVNGYTVATCSDSAEAQRVKDEIVTGIRKIEQGGGNGLISLKESDGGVIIEVIIDDL